MNNTTNKHVYAISNANNQQNKHKPNSNEPTSKQKKNYGRSAQTWLTDNKQDEVIFFLTAEN